MAQLTGQGPTWLNGYASLPDVDGRLHLVATYSKIKPPLSEYEVGLCEWNDADNRFERHTVLWKESESEPKAPPAPRGHAVQWHDDHGQAWLLFGDPFPALKMKATYESWQDAKFWRQLTPQESVTTKDGSDSIRPHRGAIAWNEFRQRWVTVFTQLGGDSSQIGELWYAEADSPTGPWKDAIHVVTHDNYSFYNPHIHPTFSKGDSPVLLFEATFTNTFSKTQTPTPRHNYNQVLYRLDLNELVTE